MNNKIGIDWESPEKKEKKPKYTLRRIGAGILLVFALAGGLKLVKEVKQLREHLSNPYNYAEQNKIVVLREGEGLLKAVEKIDGFSYEFDYRPILEHVKEMPENEETLHGGEIVPDGAGIFVPVSMEKNED